MQSVFYIEVTGRLVEQDMWRFYVAFDANDAARERRELRKLRLFNEFAETSWQFTMLGWRQ